jgi:hypothetical protein
MITYIHTNSCFDCNSTAHIVYHHVVPQSLGGKNTIPLCQPCHDKVHNIKPRNISISNLTKQGLLNAKQRGVKLGGPNPTISVKAMNLGASKKKQNFKNKMIPIFTQLKHNGYNTLQSIADYLNNNNIPTRTGKLWSPGTVRNILVYK